MLRHNQYFDFYEQAKSVMDELVKNQHWKRKNKTEISNGLFWISIRKGGEEDTDEWGEPYEAVLSVKSVEPFLAHSKDAAEAEVRFYEKEGWTVASNDDFRIVLKSPEHLLTLKLESDNNYWTLDVGFSTW